MPVFRKGRLVGCYLIKKNIRTFTLLVSVFDQRQFITQFLKETNEVYSYRWTHFNFDTYIISMANQFKHWKIMSPKQVNSYMIKLYLYKILFRFIL